ncbi:MAG: hypothetical protein KDB53_06985 [Planctomycetes bacterium]|nr:hypothetical protein [Planctomycetota bacterium]
MNDFAKLIKEAMTDVEFQSDADSLTVDAERAIASYRTRSRTTRWMAFIAMGFWTAILAWMAYLIWNADDATPTRLYALWLLVSMLGITAIGLMKLWWMLSHNHLTILKEIQLMHLRWNQFEADHRA